MQDEMNHGSTAKITFELPAQPELSCIICSPRNHKAASSEPIRTRWMGLELVCDSWWTDEYIGIFQKGILTNVIKVEA